jgi:hypothetical protein
MTENVGLPYLINYLNTDMPSSVVYFSDTGIKTKPI